MKVYVNILELASELADQKIIRYQKDALNGFVEELPLPNGIRKKTENGDTIYTEEAQKLFNQYYDDFYAVIKKLGVVTSLKDYIKDKIKHHEFYVNNEMMFSEFDETIYESNIDCVMSNKGGFEDFNIGYEQAKRATYFEILKYLK